MVLGTPKEHHGPRRATPKEDMAKAAALLFSRPSDVPEESDEDDDASLMSSKSTMSLASKGSASSKASVASSHSSALFLAAAKMQEKKALSKSLDSGVKAKLRQAAAAEADEDRRTSDAADRLVRALRGADSYATLESGASSESGRSLLLPAPRATTRTNEAMADY